MAQSSSSIIITNNAMGLVRELRDNPDLIPPYNKELVTKSAQQITELFDANMATLTDLKNGKVQEENQAITMVRVRQTAIEQIKRCCCAYLNERIVRLRHLRWKSGGQVPDETKAALSKEELNWLSTYNQITFNFQAQFGGDEDDLGSGCDGVNLLNHVEPPKTLMVQVRALRNFGNFETSEGTRVNLRMSSLQYLPRQDCENLVRKGVLEYVTDH